MIHVFDGNSISDNNVDKYADNLTDLIHMNQLGSHAILNEKIDRGKDFIIKQDSQARNNIGQDFSHLEMK